MTTMKKIKSTKYRETDEEYEKRCNEYWAEADEELLARLEEEKLIERDKDGGIKPSFELAIEKRRIHFLLFLDIKLKRR